jgi:hypothetical protein
VSSAITLPVLRTWVFGVDGFVHWLAVSPGSDPWFRFDGGGTALVYPGARFGLEEPIAGVRLKLQRNAVQDLALLSKLQRTETLKQEVTRRYNNTNPKEWWTPRPRAAGMPADEIGNADIADASPKDPRFERNLDAAAWQRVRDYVLKLAEGIQ